MIVEGEKWLNFSPRFGLKNLNRRPLPWSERRGKLAAFCREELIDYEDYWQLLADLMAANDEITFHYCGVRAIHQKWVTQLGIQEERLIMLDG